MHIGIEWFEGKYPQFNVSLAGSPDRDPFLTIKGCRIVDGSKGQFVSWPATKNEKTGKYWSHVWGSDAFAEKVLAEALKARKPAARDESVNQSRMQQRDKHDDSDIPF
jgi:DNA-binding cell septation regulator SpoVG